MQGITLSKTAIDKYLSCPLCFWLEKRHGLKRPEGISSKVWKGIERECIAHFERHRQAGTLPPELVGQVPDGSVLYTGDRISLKDLRNWRRGLAFKVNDVEVSTALDELLQRPGPDGNTVYSVCDYKTKSKATDEETTAGLYQTQLDVFDLALNANGFPTDGAGYFSYWYPTGVSQATPPPGVGLHGEVRMTWACQVVRLQADHERIKKIVLEAAACLDGPIPESGAKCPYCTYSVARRDLMAEIAAEKKAAQGAGAAAPSV